MQLLDDHMFKLWKSGHGGEEGSAGAGQQCRTTWPTRIAKAERGMFDDE